MKTTTHRRKRRNCDEQSYLARNRTKANLEPSSCRNQASHSRGDFSETSMLSILWTRSVLSMWSASTMPMVQRGGKIMMIFDLFIRCCWPCVSVCGFSSWQTGHDQHGDAGNLTKRNIAP